MVDPVLSAGDRDSGQILVSSLDFSHIPKHSYQGQSTCLGHTKAGLLNVDQRI